eukprot:366501-Chlamydomonas_euryale.AAC.22
MLAAFRALTVLCVEVLLLPPAPPAPVVEKLRPPPHATGSPAPTPVVRKADTTPTALEDGLEVHAGWNSMQPLRSPAVASPNVAKIREDVDAFLLQLPRGGDVGSRDFENKVSERLYEAEVGRTVLKDKMEQW